MALLQMTIYIETSLFLLSLLVLHGQGARMPGPSIEQAQASQALRRCHVGTSGDVVTTGAPEEDCVCGQVNRNIRNRVIGGQIVEENEYPWQVLVKATFETDPPHSQECGGTLLDSLTVLTAAHCFYNETTSRRAVDWMVILGEHDRNNPTGKEIYDGEDMTYVFLHPNYSMSLGSNDIALIFLTTPVSWSENPKIRPACLPSEEATQEKYVNRAAMATGWGKIEVDARVGVPILREVPIQVISQETCRDSYKNDTYITRIINTGLFCAGLPFRDTCQGDSGGPLVVSGHYGQYEVIGVTKGGKGCGEPGFPGLYSSTIHYRAWILSQRAAWGRASLAARRCHVGSGGDDLEDCVCGRVNRADHDRIRRAVGGVRVEQNEYPWQVLVETMFESSGQLCGGTLIDSLTVLTTAHCFYLKAANVRAIGARVTLGEHDRAHFSGKEEYDGVPMSNVVLHPGYNLSHGANDIALIFLSSPVSWSDHPTIRPACLPSEEATKEKYVGRYAVATGWGKTHLHAPTSENVLREVSVLVRSQQTCMDSYKNHRLGQYMDDGVLCAGEPGRDTCQGDAGGPLVVRDRYGHYEVIGVTKGGRGCGEPGFPGIYTSTIHYRAWILQERAAWVHVDYDYYDYD